MGIERETQDKSLEKGQLNKINCVRMYNIPTIASKLLHFTLGKSYKKFSSSNIIIYYCLLNS